MHGRDHVTRLKPEQRDHRLKFAGFHNQSPLLTMVYASAKKSGEKKSKGGGSQGKFQLLQTNYMKRIKLFLFAIHESEYRGLVVEMCRNNKI